MKRPARPVSPWAWAVLGLAGSILIAVGGPQAVDGPATPWWYEVAVPGGQGMAIALIYVGIAILCAAWLGLGRSLAGRGRAAVLAIGGLWLVPLALGPVLFSHDAYGYLAQSTVLHLGHNPYRDPPAVLAGLGHARVLAPVSPIWRHITAPYGPLFLGLVSLVVGLTGSHLVAGILVVRFLELIGLALLAWAVPRLAQALGAAPLRALWLALLSPLVMVELVAAGHNDVLMIALLSTGLVLALRGHPLAGVVLCLAAATIKAPALAGAAFIAVAWAREEHTWRARVRFLFGVALATAAVAVTVSAATGLGLSWLSGGLFAGPARVRVAITPATQVGYTAASLLHGLGISAHSRAIEAALGRVSIALVGILALWLLCRVRIPRLVPYLGILFLAAAAGGPAPWPWYLTWGLVLLAACPGPQRSVGLKLLAVAPVFLIKPDGILALPLPSAPAVLVVYILLAALFWRSRRGGGGDRDGPRQHDLEAEGQPAPKLAGLAALHALPETRAR